MTSILARHRRSASESTLTLTQAQQVAMEVMVAIDPVAQANPELARQLAADAGFPITEPRKGLATLLHSNKRG